MSLAGDKKICNAARKKLHLSNHRRLSSTIYSSRELKTKKKYKTNFSPRKILPRCSFSRAGVEGAFFGDVLPE